MNNSNEYGQERRSETRLPVTIDGEIFFGRKSAPINIKNISENGIGFEVDKDVYKKIKFNMDDVIRISFTDAYDWENDDFYDIYMLEIKIRQIREEEMYVYIGGRVTRRGTPDYSDYVYNKKTEHFITMTGFDKRIINNC